MDQPNLEFLPRAYRVALLLQALGADDDLIAECLDIEPTAVPLLLDIGIQKLDRVREVSRDRPRSAQRHHPQQRGPGAIDP